MRSLEVPSMRAIRCPLLLVAVLAVLPALAQAPCPQYSLLVDVPGYNLEGSVVVPLWPLADWLGASVEDGGRWAVVHRGEAAVYVQLPQAAWGGAMAVVPLRVVAEGVGARVRYHDESSEIGAQLGHIPVVELTLGDRQALAVVHGAPPPLVAGITDAVGDEALGKSWLLRVSAVAGEYAKTHEPQWDEAFGFSQRYVTGVLLHRNGQWLYLLRSTRVSHSRAELADAGVPPEVARQLGMEIED